MRAISTLETALDAHQAHPALSPTYNPTLLRRAPAIASDISFFLNTTSWKTHAIHASLIAHPPDALTAYTQRISEIAESTDPSALLAHAYVRYLGDLSGGQFVKRAVIKAYGLQSEDQRGTDFYVFNALGENRPANMGDMRKIKGWFASGMEEGIGGDVETKRK